MELPQVNIFSRVVKKSQLVFLFLVMLLAGCRKERLIISSHAFYYWKHEFRMAPAEDSAVTSLGIQKMYVKFFDVTLSEGGPTPVAVTDFDSSSLRSNIEYVPVIFITQATLHHTEENMIDSLASLIVTKTMRMAEREGLRPREIQLDCDWAAHTKDKYFRLVQTVKKLVAGKSMITSCTIRLHQVKYKKESGIPPCDRGMLMFYNMSDWRSEKTRNSIFDPDEAEKYINYIKDYPMNLDMALPIFHWSIAYRDEKFLAILDGVTREMLQSKDVFEVYNTNYLVYRDTFAFGAGLKGGDIIRPETCNAEMIAKFSSRISNLLPDEERSFALYHLDSATLSLYSHDDLQALFPH